MKWQQRVRVATGLSCWQIMLHLLVVAVLVMGWMSGALVRVGLGLCVLYGVTLVSMLFLQRHHDARWRDVGDFLEELTTTWYFGAAVIVLWQTILIAMMSLPLALVFWVWPTPGQWGLALVGGVAGTLGHYCLTRSFASADISATQSVKFVDLLWAALLGWVAFGDTLRPTTLVGGAIIVAAIVLLERYERRRPAPTSPSPPDRP